MGLANLRPRYHGYGVASTAWQIGSEIAVRFMRTDNARPVTYRAEHAIMARLIPKVDRIVPIPIVNSHDMPMLPHGLKAWAMESWVHGHALTANDGLDVWKAVGSFLKHLHSIDLPSFGPLMVDSSGRLIGAAATPLAGLKMRWRSAPLWLGDEPDSLGRIKVFAPSLCRRIERHDRAVQAAATSERVVLLHSDLHSEHVILNDQRLSGILDFGGSYMGHPAWDFAAIGIFNGWAAADIAIRAYSQVEYREMRRYSRLLGLSFGLYRFNAEINLDHWSYAEIMLRHLMNAVSDLGECE